MRPAIQLFADSQVESVVKDAFRVLEEVGIVVANAEGLRLLAGAGAPPDAGGRVRLPERLVREALSTTPHAIQLYDRDGDPAMDLSGRNVHFDPGSAAIYLLDPRAGRRREASTADLIDLARLGCMQRG